MGKPSPPSPPSATEMTEAQARANRIDQFTPWGSLVFSGPDRNVATTTLSPDQQAILDMLTQAQMGLGERAYGDLAGLPGTGDVIAGLPGLPSEGDVMAARQAAEEATFGRGLRLLEPVYEQQRQRMEQGLATGGIPVGTQAYSGAVDDYYRNYNAAMADLADRSVMAGGAEASRLLSDAIRGRQQGLGEQQFRINEIMSQLGLASPTPPQFYAPGAVDVVGPAQMQYQGELARYNANQSLLGGLMGLGGTLGAAYMMGPGAAPAAAVLPFMSGR